MSYSNINTYANNLQMMSLSHDNINLFIGICVEPEHTMYVMEYAAKGSLQVIHICFIYAVCCRIVISMLLLYYCYCNIIVIVILLLL